MRLIIFLLLTCTFFINSGIICDKSKLKDMHVLIVDDQISSGKTFDYLKERYSITEQIELLVLEWIIEKSTGNYLIYQVLERRN